MRLRDLSIERKFFLTILPVCLFPTVVFITLAIGGSRLTHVKTMGSELEKQSSLFAERFNNFLSARLLSTRMAARRLDDPRIPPDELTQRLAEINALGLAELLVRLRPDGRQQVDVVDPDSEAAQLRGAIDLTELLRQFPPHDVPQQGAVLDQRISVTGRVDPFPVAMLAMPQSDGGMLLFVTSIDTIIRQFRRSLAVPPDFFVVYSNNGHLIYSSRPVSEAGELAIERVMQRHSEEQKWFELSIENHPYLFSPAGSTAMKSTEGDWPEAALWSFILTYDLESYLGPQDQLIWLAVLVGLILVLALMLLARWLARMIVQPLLDLKQQAGRLAQGDLAVRAASGSHDEIGDLAETFNAMAFQLQQTYRELERKMEENRLRVEHINAINEIAHANLQAKELDTIFENLRRDLYNIIPFDAIWIAQFNHDNSDLRMLQVYPARLVTLIEKGRIPLENSLHGTVIEREETLQAEIGPSQRVDFFESRVFASEGYQSYLISPLPSRQGVIGALGVASVSPDAFNHESAEIMTSLSSAVSIALEQNEIFRQIAQFAQELERKVMDRTQELERARLKLSQAEKYFALGRLAGNLAHEVNNPLGIIKNYLQLVRENLERAGGGRRGTDPSLEHIQIINEEVNRIAGLMHNLLDLHRPAEHSVQALDLNLLIDEILTLMQDNLKVQQIQIERRFAIELNRPLVSRDLIRQVLINLIRNAQDAMERGGRLTIETAAIEGPNGPGVRIRIGDTGCGISPDHLDRIFDPFFTTKSEEKGTGLGLCVSYSIVHMYNGTIDVSSELGRGTTVTVTLPLRRPLAANPQPMELQVRGH